MKPSDFKVGQQLYYVPSDRRRGVPIHVVVSKVGNRWVYFNHLHTEFRFSPSDMRVDGGDYSSPGMVYLDKAAHEELVSRNRAWDAVRQCVAGTYTCPRFLTAADLDTLTEMLVDKK